MARPEHAGVGRRALLRGLIALGAGTVTATAAEGYYSGRHATEVTRTRLLVPGFASALEGVRIVLLTDTHRSEMVPRADIERAVDLALAERPDLIVLGGDYVTWGAREFVDDSADALERLTAPHGVYAILGNHDDDRDMPAALARRGFIVLRDARTQVPLRGERLDLIGIRYWTRRGRDIAALLRGAGPNHVLLAHDPRRLPEAAALRIPLMLSGHTHGGQVVLPGLGPLAARKFPVVAGAGQQADTTIFVSRGIGTVYLPIRVNCPPEVAVLTIATNQGVHPSG